MAISRQGSVVRKGFLAVPYGFLNAYSFGLVELYYPVEPNKVSWDADTGTVTGLPVACWKGRAIITPNKDWRARSKNSAYELTAEHAYRVQIGHLKKNLLVPRAQWETVAPIRIGNGVVVKVVENIADQRLVGVELVVRNATSGSDFWQPTLLCDVNTGEFN